MLFAMVDASDSRHAAAWALVQFLSGVWAGVLGANSPFLHGLVAGIPALVLGLVVASPLPLHFVSMAWFLAPAAALVAAALMRCVRHRRCRRLRSAAAPASHRRRIPGSPGARLR